jgi:hypothetical protein
MQPRIVSWADLVLALGPYLDTRSLRHDLHDLWMMGAPIPQRDPHAPQKRVLLPTQFAAWWGNMARRHCLSPEFKLYGGKARPKEKHG